MLEHTNSNDTLRESFGMRSTAKYLLSVLVVLVGASVLPGQTRPQERTKSKAAFEQLSSLVGNWDAVQDGVPVEETYTLTANGTALMAETKPANSPAMITMFTVDGDHMIATHYCVTGNQPYMVARVPGDLEKGMTFSLKRVTGMKTPADWHNTGLTVTLDDKDHMTQRWTYLYKGKAGTTVFHYTRRT
jgi:hypothetical protein